MDTPTPEFYKELEGFLASMSEADKRELDKLLARELDKSVLWRPDPRNEPQCKAYYSKADLMLYGGQPGGGKALHIDTQIPTVSGWKRMVDIEVGDQLFDETGAQCRVLSVSPVMIGRECFELRFSDGCTVISDADHGWFTLDTGDRFAAMAQTPEWREARRAKRPKRGTGKRPDLAEANRSRELKPQRAIGKIRTTKELEETLFRSDGGLNHSIGIARPLVCDPADLPIDPYLFGAWLGDGKTSGARLTIAETEMVELATAAAAVKGWEVRKGATALDYGVVGGMKAALCAIGVLGAKEIPQQYLRASFDQRLSLLQGLMDTDGYADTRGQCELTTTSETLALGYLELIRSLGCKATICVGDATLNGRVISPKYRLKFLAPLPVFRLQRKLDRQKLTGHRPTVFRRYIEEVKKVSSVPVRCIQVDSPSRLFLCGLGMIPTHNSDLLIGMALTQHYRSVIFRRQATDLGDIGERIIQVAGRAGWNSVEKVMRLPDRSLELGHLEKPGSELTWQGGLGHDFIGFDEGAQLQKAKVQFVLGWLRSTKEGQRCRAIIASNPPTSDEGAWLVEWFAPWLDPGFPKPAIGGELRYAVSALDKEGTTLWVADSSPIIFEGESTYRKATAAEIAGGDPSVTVPLSRTFIPSQLADNPFLSNTGYKARLQALPEPLRTQLLTGDFLAGRKDHEHQVIPTAWIEAAMARWTADPPKCNMTAMGVDVAQGGDDQTVIAVRYGGWFGPLVKKPGKECRDATAVAAAVVTSRRDQCPIVVDLGGGFGGDTLGLLERQGIPCTGYLGLRKSNATTREGHLRFSNRRAEDWWRMREELDPGQQFGSAIALPNDAQLKAELAAPRIRDMSPTRGIQIEDKADIKKRLGRSTDCADAVVMALNEGAKARERLQRNAERGRQETANTGYSAMKGKLRIVR